MFAARKPSRTMPFAAVSLAAILGVHAAAAAGADGGPSRHPMVTFGRGRIALSHDGNGDPDDIGALPAELAMIAYAGLRSRLVHVHYLSQVWDRKSMSHKRLGEMEASALEGADRFGWDRKVFFNALTAHRDADGGRNACTDHLVAAMEASTAEDPLWLCVAGPFETVWQAAKRCDPGKRPHVKIVTHSGHNDKNAGKGDAHHTRKDVEALGSPVVDIRDQNRGFSTRKDFAPWQWLETHADADLRWVYARMKAGGKADISDAGMVYYLLTGDENGHLGKLKRFWSHKASGAGPSRTGTEANGPSPAAAPRAAIPPAPRRASHDLTEQTRERNL